MWHPKAKSAISVRLLMTYSYLYRELALEIYFRYKMKKIPATGRITEITEISFQIKSLLEDWTQTKCTQKLSRQIWILKENPILGRNMIYFEHRKIQNSILKETITYKILYICKVRNKEVAPRQTVFTLNISIYIKKKCIYS